MYVWYQEWFLKKTVIRPRQKIKHWRKKIQILKNKQQKQTNKEETTKVSQTRHRIFYLFCSTA